MAISELEYKKEEQILKKVNKLLGNTLDDLGFEVKDDENKLIEFKKMMWENSNSFDEGESIQVMATTQLEAEKVFRKKNYFDRLCKIRK